MYFLYFVQICSVFENKDNTFNFSKFLHFIFILQISFNQWFIQNLFE